MMKQNRLICLVLIYAILQGFFIQTIPAQNEDSQNDKKEAKGLQFRLREGIGKTTTGEIPTASQAVKLNEAESAAILRRLPPIKAETGDNTDFSTRPDSLPPPKTGKVIPIKFPASEQQSAPQTENPAALEVLRASPNNNVPFVKDLSVTF